ncbi:MAG: hypothetical protein MRY57_00845 [Candidatus Pacebacteria bacterium]|nr:hypothetical protein [Candidatus Paceibacterota bacterium]
MDQIRIYYVKDKNDKKTYKLITDIGDTILRIEKVSVNASGDISPQNLINLLNNSIRTLTSSNETPLPKSHMFLKQFTEVEIESLQLVLKKDLRRDSEVSGFLSSRALNCLKSVSIYTLYDLLKEFESFGDIIQLRNAGKTTIDEIMKLLDHFKLDLKMDPEIIMNYKM